MSSDFQVVIRELANQNWRVDQTARGHYKAYPPDRSRPFVTFGESGDHRAIKNTIAQLRRSGFAWPPHEPEKKPSNGNGYQVPDVSDAVTPDELFAGLKRARTEHLEAVEMLRESEEELAKATRLRDEAREEVEQTARILKSAKEAFDRAFDSGT